MEDQLLLRAKNQDWCDLFFKVIQEQWESVGDTMEISCIQVFADNNGLKANIPRDEFPEDSCGGGRHWLRIYSLVPRYRAYYRPAAKEANCS